MSKTQSPQFAPITRRASADTSDAAAEALARAKGINHLEPPSEARTAPLEPDDDDLSAPEGEGVPAASKPAGAADIARADLDSRPSKADDIKMARVGLEKKYKRQLEDFAKDRDMTLQALILRALDQYGPLRDAGIRPKKGDLAIKDGRRLRGGRKT